MVVFIAYENELFKRYDHSRLSERSIGILKAGQVVSSKSGILWNFSPIERSTNWKEMGNTHILDYYAFPKPGLYYLKAVLGVPSNENPIKVESKPIKIRINEPVGEDLEVWNKIKDKQEIGYFIQEGYFRTFNSLETENLKREIEQIALKHPSSLLSKQLMQSLEKFRSAEEQRKADLEKRKIKPTN